jgi:hypothetical protein
MHQLEYVPGVVTGLRGQLPAVLQPAAHQGAGPVSEAIPHIPSQPRALYRLGALTRDRRPVASPGTTPVNEPRWWQTREDPP